MSTQRFVVIGGLLAASLTLNVVLLARDTAPEPKPAGPAEPGPAEPAPAQPASAAPTPPVPVETTKATAKPAAAPVVVGDWNRVSAAVSHSIARTFSGAVSTRADELSAEYARLFVWDLSLQRDVQKGDQIVAVWRETTGEDPLQIGAASFKSGKLGRRLTAYRFTPPGDKYPSYWFKDGSEVPRRLESGPLRDYVQVTSLLKDRPTHKGMDFKCPTGTPVYAPKAGLITRSNWNWKANGNAVELKFADGVVAKFLHLSKNLVKPGQRVKAGQLIAHTGNTGRTTAPHLHYQLNRGVGGATLDPLDYHQTRRRKMPADARPAFDAKVVQWDRLLKGS